MSLLLSSVLMAQTYTISGKITDSEDKNEVLIGANVIYGEGQGVLADLDGNYTLKLPAGEYTITFSYVGYKKETKNINLTSDITLDVQLNASVLMQEVQVIADVAIARETPVAFSTLTPKTLEENMASQDIPMVLNSTPGVYATQEGGGDGDAQITIRGFSSRNVGVLLDGVPVNDMETGQVYWSNWFGLDAVTRSMQVQRGLGASKLALPSVGGTINIITKGMESKRGGNAKQEIGSDGYTRTSVGYNTGALKNGWAFSGALSYKQTQGWVDQLWSKGLFYYVKVDKSIGNHTLSLSAYGAPQKHAQRSAKTTIAVYDSVYSEQLGAMLHETDDMTQEEKDDVKEYRSLATQGINRGLRYNQHWGYLQREGGEREPFNESVNEYHKPQFTLKDSWQISNRTFMSNILYMSIGRGGGTRLSSEDGVGDDGQIDFQNAYDRNIKNKNELYSKDENASGKFIQINKNEHTWAGLLSTFDHRYNNQITFSGGIDLKYYNGTHYDEVYDLIGGDYVPQSGDFLPAPPPGAGADYWLNEPYKENKLYVGDRGLDFWTDGYVGWAGAFFQTEYKTEKFSTFINITGANSSYMQKSHYYGIIKSVVKETTDWQHYLSGTAKIGANYNFNDHHNAFINMGYISRAPNLKSVFDYSNNVISQVVNEQVLAIEGGYGFSSKSFSANVNLYRTAWKDRPETKGVSVGGDYYKAYVQGMDALHQGGELDFVWEIIPSLSFQGLVSIGDWRWDAEDDVVLYNNNNIAIDTVSYDARGVHVGNSAQTQLGAEIRWEPIKYLYFKPRITYFDRYYAEFDPFSLNKSPNSYEWYDPDTKEHGDPRDSWQVPSYYTLDLHAGYSYKLKDCILSLRVNVLNVLNTKYVATAYNNAQSDTNQRFNDFDAKSASVYMGLGRRFNMSLGVKF